MMKAEDSSRLMWLTAALAEQRRKISGLFRHMSCFGGPGSLKPGLFRKFSLMLEQVACAREKELKIINRIEAIEETHRMRRAHNRLYTFHPSASHRNVPIPASEAEDEVPQPTHGIWWYLALLFLLDRPGNQKKQGLTAD